MSRYGESARNMMAILDLHPVKLPPNAISATLRAQMVASGWLVEPKPQPYDPDSLKNSQYRRERNERLQRAFNEVEARWGITDLPRGEVKGAAIRHGVSHQLLLNKFYKARQAGKERAA